MTEGPSTDSKTLPTVREATSLAWDDTFSALHALPNQAFIAFAALVVLAAIQSYLRDQPSPINTDVIKVLLCIVQAYLIAPFLIAVHRFIILGTHTQGYDLNLGARVTRFFGWSIVPTIFSFSLEFLSWTLGLALAVMAIGLLLRFMLLLPAIAVDAPGATLYNAWADSEGYVLRILGLLLLTALQIAAAALVILIIGRGITTAIVNIFGFPPNPALRILSILLGAALAVVSYTLTVCIASRLFEQISNRLKQSV